MADPGLYWWGGGGQAGAGAFIAIASEQSPAVQLLYNHSDILGRGLETPDPLLPPPIAYHCAEATDECVVHFALDIDLRRYALMHLFCVMP